MRKYCKETQRNAGTSVPLLAIVAALAKSAAAGVRERLRKICLAMLADHEIQHLERVHAAVGGNDPRPDSAISASWKRSAVNFGVDPASKDAPRILTAEELKDHQQPTQEIICTAREELDQLFRISRSAGYVVLMSDAHGVCIDHRVEQAPSSHFAEWGNVIGGIWSEAAEGTNGTGTCIAERRPVTIHRSEHFRFRHIGSSCSAAPIFGVHDELIGVLDISSTDPTLSENAHMLAGALVTEAAHAIGERNFRDRFRRHWIVSVACPQVSTRTALMAVDNDRQIVGMDHDARASFACRDASVKMGFWMLFERDDGVFQAQPGGSDFAIRLVPIGGTEGLPALITPPEQAAAIWRNSESAWFHCRPRTGLLTTAPQPQAFPQLKGGLPPWVLRRVKDYIESHLHERIELKQLALAAGVSMYHFAHAFKASVGIPPHQFVLQRRIRLACDLLANSDRPIVDIALVVGFSDQAHLARQFRHYLGLSPTAFRRSHR